MQLFPEPSISSVVFVQIHERPRGFTPRLRILTGPPAALSLPVCYAPKRPMHVYCDVALPVPLDRVFTYLGGDTPPSVGARVLVPFRNEKLAGGVMRVHDDRPPVEAKPLLSVLDEQPVFSPELMELGLWIAQ